MLLIKQVRLFFPPEEHSILLLSTTASCRRILVLWSPTPAHLAVLRAPAAVCAAASSSLLALGNLEEPPAQVGTSSPLLCVVFFVIASELLTSKTSFQMAFKSDSCNSCHSFKSTNFVRIVFLKVGSGLESFSIWFCM